jgi:peptide/nickel transport system substrate-binding protein
MQAKRRHVTMSVIGVAAMVAASLVGVSSPAAAQRSTQSKGGGGGTISWALEAETTGGWCINQARLAQSGLQVARAIYDSLTILNDQGKYVPYLAQSFTPNATFDEWTIKLRPGVKFQDGEPLDAAAVKLNLDSLRGKNPNLPSELFTFVLSNIADVTTPDASTVVITTKVPWVALPAAFAASNTSIMAPAQINNPDTCATNMIGTGPFKLVEWRPNESLTVERNPDYWRKGFPKADKIIFKPVTDSQARATGLTGGTFDMITTSDSQTIVNLEGKAKQGDIKVLASDKGAETAYVLLNSSKAPFDSKTARLAVAYAGDAPQVNAILNKGLNRIATGPFPPDSPAYLPKRPINHNLKKAKALVAKYKQETGQDLSWEYVTQPDPATLAIAQLVKEQQGKAGIEVTIRTVDQATLIQQVIAGTFQGAGFRNHAGGDPDTQYNWWHSGSPVNFGRINDPVIDKLLDEGRSEPDPAKRTKIYLDLNRRFQSEVWNLWSWYTFWGLAYQNNVSGVKGPPLPDGGGKPFPLFAGVIPVLTIAKK